MWSPSQSVRHVGLLTDYASGMGSFLSNLPRLGKLPHGICVDKRQKRDALPVELPGIISFGEMT